MEAVKNIRKRKTLSSSTIRKAWQENVESVCKAGFDDEVIFNIVDDNESLRICWCCGDQGYQEKAHIIPFALGGKCAPENFFLLCDLCHIGSPDVIDPSYFINYVNRESGRARKQKATAIESAMKKVVSHLEVNRSDDQGEISKRFNLACGRNLDTMQHGANTALSTRLAGIDMALNSSLAAFNNR